eukprot:1733620-Pleurochrysis_carterae.AAC.1
MHFQISLLPLYCSPSALSSFSTAALPISPPLLSLCSSPLLSLCSSPLLSLSSPLVCPLAAPPCLVPFCRALVATAAVVAAAAAPAAVAAAPQL